MLHVCYMSIYMQMEFNSHQLSVLLATGFGTMSFCDCDCKRDLWF